MNVIDPVRATTAQEDTSTTVRWRCLRGIAGLNVVFWVITYARIDGADAYQLWQVRLAAVYVLVCAYGSWLPRIDLERYCLVDSAASRIFSGRSAATLAEMTFAAQMALRRTALVPCVGFPSRSTEISHYAAVWGRTA